MDVLEQIAGGILVTAGLWLWAPPVAIIVLGVMLGLHGFLRELKSIREKETADAGSREPTALDDPTRYS